VRSALLATALVAVATAPVMAQATVQGFGQDTFSLRLPAGYRLVAQTSPGPGMMAFGFASNQRSDGTRSLIQVTLIDLDKGPGGPPPPLDEIAASMIGGVRQRRDQWKQAESTVTIDGVNAKLIRWSGTNAPSPERPSGQAASAMHGVMVIGIKGMVAFTLHAQDLDAFASATLPASEGALMSFTLKAHD